MVESKNIIRITLGTGLILLIPLLAGWPWSLFDFIIMGALLFSTGLILELVMSKLKNTQHRVIATIVILAIFFLVWAELAVGVFGTPFAGN